MSLPTDFFFQYENYVSRTPHPEIMRVTRQADAEPMLHYHTWLVREQQLSVPLELHDFAAVVRLVTEEVPFWELPADILGKEVLEDGDWPLFTLRYAGREHRSGGSCAGYWHPGIAHLQTVMRRLYEKYLLFRLT